MAGYVCAQRVVMSRGGGESREMTDMSRDKSHSARDIDVQPATIDVSDDDTLGKLEKTPSHSLPAVTLGSAGTGSGGSRPAGQGGGRSAAEDGMDPPPAFVDVDDIAMHVDRDPNRWHDTVRVSIPRYTKHQSHRTSLKNLP